MQENKYLNEERYQQSVNKIKKISKILLIIGISLLIVGIILIVLGFMGFGKTATNGMNSFDFQSTSSRIFGLTVLGGFMIFIGFGLTFGGIITTVVAHGREIKAFTVQQTMPIAKEGIETIAPSVGKAAETISKSIARGIAEGKKEAENK